jgi:hypothetical protein
MQVVDSLYLNKGSYHDYPVIAKMSDIRPSPAPLPTVPREDAPYFVLIKTFQHPFDEKKATVYVKEGEYFRSQGGLIQEWGSNWIGIQAASLNDARLKAHASEGTACPRWHLEM